ncbi:MAG: DUF2231 domain-containing protein [Minisyncoccota bacterium]
MNIHPLFVHFPIALLTVYALAEIIWYKKITLQTWWWNFKAALLTLGVIGGFVALQTGDIAESIKGRSSLIEIHSTFAAISVWIFSALLFSYIIKFISLYKSEYVQYGFKNKAFYFVEYVGKFITKISILLAFIGLITLTITGALGGAIVYGPDVDPVVNFIYSIVVGL